MAPGELARTESGPTQSGPDQTLVERDVEGSSKVVTLSGRESEASEVLAQDSAAPFNARQLSRLDDALTLAGQQSGLLFTLWVGELGGQSRARAEELHASLGDSASEAVLVAVSPGERVVEVITGEESHRRIDDRGAKLAVMSMVASFKESDLVGGLVEGLAMLADQAGGKHRG